MYTIRITLLILVACLSIDSWSQIKKRENLKADIVYVLDQYKHHLEENGDGNLRKYHFAVSAGSSGDGTVLFITAVGRMSFFLHGIPDYYTVNRNKFVFMFDLRSKPTVDSTVFKNLFDQFKDSLKTDVSRDGKLLKSSSLLTDEIICWRVELIKGMTTRITESTFPTKSITFSYKYDEEGNPIAKDGIPDYTGWPQYGPHWNGTTPRKFILNNTDVPKDSLDVGLTKQNKKSRNVRAVLVVDNKGRIVESKVVGIVHEATRRKVEEALLRIPNWSPATRNGKPIKVRIRVGL